MIPDPGRRRQAGARATPSRDVAAPSRPADRDALAVLASADGVGPATLERLLATFGGAGEVLRIAIERRGAADLAAALRVDGSRSGRVSRSAIDAIVGAARDAERLLEDMRDLDVHAIVAGDRSYPRRLLTIELPPRVLFVRGSDAALEADVAVAVVGTRRPTDLGRRTASRIGAALSRAGALVVSGLALGIDGAAHASVVEASGTTLAVIGGGHGRLSPVAHDRLAAAIVEHGGAVVSEHAPRTQPSRGTFPRRNRIISGLADAVIVVEAGTRSGALLTAAWAMEQGRECFFVPGSIEAPESAGCLAWLRDFGGVARIVAGVPQLLEDLGLAGSAAFATASGDGSGNDADMIAGRGLRPPRHDLLGPSVDAVAMDLPAREAALVRALAAGATTADELAALTGLPIGAVLAGLTVLEGRSIVTGTYGRYAFSTSGPSVEPG